MIIFAGQPVRLRDAQVVESLAARAVDDTLPDWAAEPRRLRMSLELDFDESSNSAVASARAAATDKDARWAVFVMVMVSASNAVSVGPRRGSPCPLDTTTIPA